MITTYFHILYRLDYNCKFRSQSESNTGFRSSILSFCLRFRRPDYLGSVALVLNFHLTRSPGTSTLIILTVPDTSIHPFPLYVYFLRLRSCTVFDSPRLTMTSPNISVTFLFSSCPLSKPRLRPPFACSFLVRSPLVAPLVHSNIPSRSPLSILPSTAQHSELYTRHNRSYHLSIV